MKLIERYIFRRILAAVALASIALGLMIWLSQALREFQVVTVDGQALTTFLELSVLLLPVLVAVIVPVTVMIGVLYAFSAMNADSELVIVNAAGARQSAILKPTLAAALIATAVVASMTLYISPLSSRQWTKLITSIRGDVIVNFVHEGAFVQLAPGLTFHMDRRNSDGSLGGIFVADFRDPEQSNTYLADRGTVIENPLGVFLIMADGTIQQRRTRTTAISLIEFTSYAFDLSSFSAGSDSPTINPNERATDYLFDPNPNDPLFRDRPGLFYAELTDRFAAPLYCFIFALVPLLFIGQAHSSRQSNNASIAAAVVVALALRIAPFTLPTETSLVARLAAIGLPLLAIAVLCVLVLRGVQLRPPERLVALAEALFARASGLVGGTPTATAR